ncbi:hypothetical protein GCM10011312_07990 [Planktosalinus lacus]|uniref:Uncharacterized protein n=2 Tax=Planktosalinus lacus TaxID=1526573 RepID=A0A8J2Y904_9FLAO|nr:hypothetical protein GCM10011312_07990 [Planktosalinus lacus]
MNDNNKFELILQGFENLHLNDELISFLLEKNIYRIDPNVIAFEILDKNREITFNVSFPYNEKYYRINDDVLDEIYIFLLDKIKTHPLYNMAEIEYELSICLTRKQKLKLLKKKYSETTKELTESPYSMLYFGKKYSYYNNWKEFILSHINQCHIIYYLKYDFMIEWRDRETLEEFKIHKDIDFEKNIFEFWCRCYELSFIKDFIEKRIFELEGSQNIENIKQKNILINTNETKLSGHIKKIQPIFKNDSELLFKFIVKNYEGKLDRAFFSLLYSYFNDELKSLHTGGKDSKEYRDYILLNPEYKIESFSKVIPYPDYSPTKERMQETFKKLTEKFYSE